jgi:hypothetical protein
LRIGVRFRLTDDPGALFADARAVEAAGADSIWVHATTMETNPYVLLAAFAAVTWRVRLVAKGAPNALGGSPIALGQETCKRLARGRLVVAEELDENWIHAEFPNSRDVWRSLRRAAAEANATGIVLPNDPRLVDLLRNPDQEDDRSDLNYAVG